MRPGQKVTEATALVARLTVLHVSFTEIDRALGRVAEVAMGFGITVSMQLSVSTSARGGAHASHTRGSHHSPEQRSPAWIAIVVYWGQRTSAAVSGLSTISAVCRLCTHGPFPARYCVSSNSSARGSLEPTVNKFPS